MTNTMKTTRYSYTQYFHNSQQDNSAFEIVKQLFPDNDCSKAQQIITQWGNYKPTPLIALNDIAQQAQVKNIFYKDESRRFELGSFKALGGAYAIQQLAGGYSGDKPLVVCTATDGNHGRSVAWGAQQLDIECHIFIHAHVSQTRADMMAELGAIIHRVDGNYDDSIAECIAIANTNHWHIVSDTSWDNYTEVPRQVMAGYSVMAHEIIEQLQGEIPTHIFIQAGCGGMAGGIIAYFWQQWQEKLPTIIMVESDMSDCVYQSLVANQILLIDIVDETIMAGLSCGEVSQLAWPILQKGASHVITINDNGVIPMMKWLAKPEQPGADRPGIEAGECSTSGLIALMAIKTDPVLAQKIGINQNSTVLVLGTEGATDPEFYRTNVLE